MKKILLSYFVIIFISFHSVQAQVAPNFSVKDINGVTHKLYEDYLDKDKIVVLSFFFADCPPCITLASRNEALYQKYGGGRGRIQFINMSLLVTDTLESLQYFRDTTKITSPIVGAIGGSLTTATPYIAGLLGPYTGLPHTSILRPDRSINFDVVPSRLEETIEATLNTVFSRPDKVSMKFTMFDETSLPDSTFFVLRSETDPNYKRNITTLTNKTNTFDYPSANFPKTDKPFIGLESPKIGSTQGINVGDLVALRRHILRLDTLKTKEQLRAADVNSDGSINIADAVDLTRYILRLTNQWLTTFSIVMDPAKVLVDPKNLGATINLNASLVRLGNVTK
jgi:peroxiredoxin